MWTWGTGEHCSGAHAREGDFARSAAEAEREAFDATGAALIDEPQAFRLEEEIEEYADVAASFARSQIEVDKQTLDAERPLFDEKDAVYLELSLPHDNRAGSAALDDERAPFERGGL